MLGFYNIFILTAIWHKLRTGRQQKLDLEYNFFLRVDAVMARMSHVFKDEAFVVIHKN